MTWDGDLRRQVLEAFRDAQKRRGELDTSDDRKPEPLSAPVLEVEETKRNRRIIRRAA